MAQFITYHILQANTSDALAASVQNAIKADWQPHGNLAVAGDSKTGFLYSQAIVQTIPDAPITTPVGR